MSKYFEPEFKKKIVRLHLEDGRTIRSLAANIAYPKQAFLTGYHSFAKNAKIMKKPKPITTI
jgi:hypothetical protein